MFPFFVGDNLIKLGHDQACLRLGLKMVQVERGHFFTPSGKKQGAMESFFSVHVFLCEHLMIFD